MATDIIVKHKVTDFASFKPGFDALPRELEKALAASV